MVERNSSPPQSRRSALRAAVNHTRQKSGKRMSIIASRLRSRSSQRSPPTSPKKKRSLSPSRSISTASQPPSMSDTLFTPKFKTSQLNLLGAELSKSASRGRPTHRRTLSADTARASDTEIFRSPSPSRSALGDGEHKANGDEQDEDTGRVFSNTLLHKFEVANEQAVAGLDSLKQIHDFMSDIASLERQHASKLTSLAASQITRFSQRKPAPDRMPSSGEAQLSVFRKFQDISEVHKQFADDIEMNIVLPLGNCYDASSNAHRLIVDHQRESADEMSRAEAAMAAAKKKALKALAATNNGADGEDILLGSSAASAGDSVSPLSDTTSKISEFGRKLAEHAHIPISKGKGKSPSELSTTALAACAKYSQAVSQANFVQKTYVSYDMPSVLAELQAMEELRIEAVMRNVRHLTELFRSTLDSLSENATSIDASVDNVDIHEDIRTFAKETIRSHGEPVQQKKPFEYDLPRSVDELLAEKQCELPSALFGGELAEMMKLLVNKDLEIPKIVPTLCEAIERLGGFQKEGIFRISAGTTELGALRKHFIMNRYNVPDDTNPHTCAALLKDFLRGLKSPLFPQELYQDCIKLGVKEKDDPDHETKSKRFRALFEKIPEVNKKVIIYLARFLDKVSKHEAVNRMSIPNLAIVFAPSFLRDPSDDIMSMMKNAQYESGFVIYFVKYLASMESVDGGASSSSSLSASSPPSSRAISSALERSPTGELSRAVESFHEKFRSSMNDVNITSATSSRSHSRRNSKEKAFKEEAGSSATSGPKAAAASVFKRGSSTGRLFRFKAKGKKDGEKSPPPRPGAEEDTEIHPVQTLSDSEDEDERESNLKGSDPRDALGSKIKKVKARKAKQLSKEQVALARKRRSLSEERRKRSAAGGGRTRRVLLGLVVLAGVVAIGFAVAQNQDRLRDEWSHRFGAAQPSDNANSESAI